MIEEILVNTKEINKRLIYPSNMPIQVIYKSICKMEFAIVSEWSR